VLGRELVTGPQRDDLQEPRVERPVGGQIPEGRHDGLRLFLEVVDLEALVVETVDGILVPPVTAALREEVAQGASAFAELCDQSHLGGLAFLLAGGDAHIHPRTSFTLRAWIVAPQPESPGPMVKSVLAQGFKGTRRTARGSEPRQSARSSDGQGVRRL
jgi:hypothetical protein